jgi:putative membrane protein
MVDPPSTTAATELAKERNRAAEERTLMAWIRTCLALISFGFGIERILAVLHQGSDSGDPPLRLSRLLGLSFVALGTGAMLAATVDHQHQLQRIRRNDLNYVSRRSPSRVVAIVLAGLGAIAFLGILLDLVQG